MGSKKVLRGEELATAMGVSWGPAEIGQAPETRNISGTYDAVGRNPDGSGYGATVDILDTASGVHLTWWSGSDSWEGQGLREGRLLTVTWEQPYPVYFVIMDDGTLHGTWFNGHAQEKLIRQKPSQA